MTRTLISVTGIEASGVHGVDPAERLEPQPFVVDLEVVVDVDGDDLDSTADYRAIAEVAREAIGGESFSLLEGLAEAVATAVVGLESVEEVTATVFKPRAAASMGVRGVSASVTVR
jgi:dihydroneopterin aldolase/2-amino-4-hydroxy-6-hydroxymethyldihydropteridine diphosphokinase